MKDVARAERTFWRQIGHVATSYVLFVAFVYAFVMVNRVYPGYLARAKDEAEVFKRDFLRNCEDSIRTSVDCGDLARKLNTPVHWRAASETVEHLNAMNTCGSACVHAVHSIMNMLPILVGVVTALVIYAVWRHIQLRDAKQTLDMLMAQSKFSASVDSVAIMGEVLRGSKTD